jgi:hypothetical protein
MGLILTQDGWGKSSRSGNNGGQCVEVKAVSETQSA